MKKRYLIVAALALSLTSCASRIEDNIVRDDMKTKTDTGSVTSKSTQTSDVNDIIEPVIVGAQVASDYSSLSTEKHGYGQGVQLDSENRPTGAIDFNNMYGKYNAKAITEDKGKIYLTFDQGYENGYTSKILDVLKEKNVKATFFVLQDYAEKNPELVQRMIDEGHTVGNHSVKHYSMPGLSTEECKNEIMGLHDYIKEKFNYEMTEFRPPMGEFSEKSLAITKDCGYKTVMWSYAYADWDVNKQPSEEVAYKKLTDAVHDGAIYLLHSVSATNTEVLPEFIDYVKEQGYEFG